jgi:hypothetical protein
MPIPSPVGLNQYNLLSKVKKGVVWWYKMGICRKPKQQWPRDGIALEALKTVETTVSEDV